MGRKKKIMELYLLRYFLSLVETGSFTKAAQNVPDHPADAVRRHQAAGGATGRVAVRAQQQARLPDHGGLAFPAARQGDPARGQHGVGRDRRNRARQRAAAGCAAKPCRRRGWRACWARLPCNGPISASTWLTAPSRNCSTGWTSAASIMPCRSAAWRTMPAWPCSRKAINWPCRVITGWRGAERIDGEDLAAEAMIVRTRCEVLSETSRHFTDPQCAPAAGLPHGPGRARPGHGGGGPRHHRHARQLCRRRCGAVRPNGFQSPAYRRAVPAAFCPAGPAGRGRARLSWLCPRVF